MPEKLNLRNPRHTSHFESHRYLLTRLIHGEGGFIKELQRAVVNLPEQTN